MDGNSVLCDKNVRKKYKNALTYYGNDKNTNKQKPMFRRIFMLSFISYKLLLEISLLFADPSIDTKRLRNELTSVREIKMILLSIEQAQTPKEKFAVGIRDDVMHDTASDTGLEEKGCEVGDDTKHGENGREVEHDMRSSKNVESSKKLRKCSDIKENGERISVVMGPRNNYHERMRMTTYCLKCLGKRKRNDTKPGGGIMSEGEPTCKRIRNEIRLNRTSVKKMKEKHAMNSIYIKSLKRCSFLSYADAMPSGDHDNQDNSAQNVGFWSSLKNMFNDKIIKNGQRIVNYVFGRKESQDLQANARDTGNAQTGAEDNEDFPSDVDDADNAQTDAEDTHPAQDFDMAVEAPSQARERGIVPTEKSFIGNSYAAVSSYCSSARKWIGNHLWGMMGYRSSEGQRDGSANATTHDNRANGSLASVSTFGPADDLTDGSSAVPLIPTRSINRLNSSRKPLARHSIVSSTDTDGCSSTTEDTFTRSLNFDDMTPLTTRANTPTEGYNFPFEDSASSVSNLPVQRNVSHLQTRTSAFRPNYMRGTGLLADHNLLDCDSDYITSDDQSLNNSSSDSIFEHGMHIPIRGTLNTGSASRNRKDADRIADANPQAELLSDIGDNDSSKSRDSSNNYCQLKRNPLLNERMLSRQISAQSQTKQSESSLNVDHSKSNNSADPRPLIPPRITTSGSGSGGIISGGGSGSGSIISGGGGSGGGSGGGGGDINNNAAPDPGNTDQNDDKPSQKSMSVVTRILLCVVLLILIALAITAFYYDFK